MYHGYAARFVGLDPDKSFGELVATGAGPLFSYYYKVLADSVSYDPILASSLSMPSFLFHGHTVYTLLAGHTELRAGRERPRAIRVPAAVLAVQYLSKGAAPNGKFAYDRQTAAEYGADRCVELSPKSNLHQIMYDLFWK